MSEKDRQRMYEMLSAYLDGESDAPQEVERLLQTDAEAARLYAELSRMSTRLKALPEPDVHPAFATRVMAHVREVREAEAATPVWRFVVPKLSVAAVAVALIGIAVWPFWPDKGITAPTQNDPIVAEVLRLRNQPDPVLAEQFGPLLSEPETGGAWSGAAENDNGLALVADPSFSRDYADVVDKVASLLEADAGYTDDIDVFEEIEALNESQSEALRLLLTDYSEGGSDLL